MAIYTYPFKRLAGFFLCTFILSACSANWHLRKAIAKDPTILQPKELVVIDTVVVTPELRVDTFALFTADTITIEKERLRVQIRRIHDTIKVSAECRADTVRIVERVKLPAQITYAPRKWWERVPLPLILLILVVIIARRVFDRWANNQ